MFNRSSFTVLSAAAALAVASQASATFGHYWPKPTPQPEPDDKCVVKAYADDYCPPYGADGSYKDAYFWSVEFDKGCADAYITSVTFDLRAGKDTNAYFDMSGSGSYGPVIGGLDGLSASDVTFTPDSGESSVVTVSFKDGAFKVGDRLWFGIDTDKLGNDDAASVGKQQVGFSVTFGNGMTYSTSFSKYNYHLSKAKIEADDCCGTLIPTPSAAGLGMLMLCGLSARRRRETAE